MSKVSQLAVPVENHIYEIIRDSYLNKVESQFKPWLDIRNLPADSLFPIVTSLTTTVSIDEDSRFAFAQVKIIILDLLPELINCASVESKEILAIQSGHLQKQALLEMSDILGNLTQSCEYDNEDYSWVGQRYLVTYQTEGLFKYMGIAKEDYKNLPFANTIMGTALIGTLKGRVEKLCCTVPLFTPQRSKV